MRDGAVRKTDLSFPVSFPPHTNTHGTPACVSVPSMRV